MSHVAKVDLKFTNAEAMKRACERAGGIFAGKGIVCFYDDTEVGGYVMQFPGWQYGVVVQNDGSLYYDNYNNEWGNIEYIRQFKQLYAVEAAKVSAEENGYAYTEEVLPTGVMKVVIEV